MTIALIIFVVLEVATVGLVLFLIKRARRYQAAMIHNAKVANWNSDLAKLDKKFAREMTVLFWLTWFVALFLWLRLRRVESQPK